MIDRSVLLRAEFVLARLRAIGWRVATAESCTGGLIAATLTAIPGSSDVVDRGFVTYTNAAKADLLGVPPDLIDSVGAVSEAVAARMAEGALRRSAADVAVAVTGIAGPGGATDRKPVGLVWFGLALRQGPLRTDSLVFPGDRAAVRAATVSHALEMLVSAAPSGQAETD